MANVKRPIVEKGIVLCKEFKKATEAFKAQDGSFVPEQPDRYIVKVASSYSITKDNGLEQANILDYKVDKDIFEKLQYLSKVEVMYEMSNGGTNKPLSLTPIN